jgi:deoxyadenosine/deoxycytidine kinase
MSQGPFWVVVDGPIGGGKTTLLEKLIPALIRDYNTTFVKEDIDGMMQEGIFQLSQESPSRWNWTAQVLWFIKRTKGFLEAWDGGAKDAEIIVSERSILSDPIFMAMQKDLGDLDDVREPRWYSMVHETWMKLYPIKPSLIVYCCPKGSLYDKVCICQERVKERNRPSEVERVTPEYSRVNIRHYQTRMGSEESPEGIPILHVDSRKNYRDDLKTSQSVTQRIIECIEELKMETAEKE